jgi:hypothetical protein
VFKSGDVSCWVVGPHIEERIDQCAFIGVLLLNACKCKIVAVALRRNSVQGYQCVLAFPVADLFRCEVDVVMSTCPTTAMPCVDRCMKPMYIM